MILYLVRHGIAQERTDPAAPSDAERPLTQRGIEKVRATMRGLRKLDADPDVIISSPYLRAAQTAEIACEVLGFPRDHVRRSDHLKPSGNSRLFFQELARIRGKEIICFGHAPNLDLAIAAALGLDIPVTSLKKAGATCLEIERFSPIHARILWLLTPRMLRKLGQ
jgi:phosphohistidine phosphatase